MTEHRNKEYSSHPPVDSNTDACCSVPAGWFGTIEDTEFIDPLSLFEYMGGGGASTLIVMEHSLTLTAGTCCVVDVPTFQACGMTFGALDLTSGDKVAKCANRLAALALRRMGIDAIQGKALRTNALMVVGGHPRPFSARRGLAPTFAVSHVHLANCIASRYGCAGRGAVTLRLGAVRQSAISGRALYAYDVVVQPLHDAPPVIIKARAFFSNDERAKRDSLIHAADQYRSAKPVAVLDYRDRFFCHTDGSVLVQPAH
jgi:hypothetical protein